MKDGSKLVYDLRKKIDMKLLETCILYYGDFIYWVDYIRTNRN